MKDFVFFLSLELELFVFPQISFKNCASFVSNGSCCQMIYFLFRPLLRGGGTIYSNGFFVQSILADRYIHRRELRLVPLEILSSVEYGIKKIFLIFVFYREISKLKLSRK